MRRVGFTVPSQGVVTSSDARQTMMLAGISVEIPTQLATT
jgi:hypothetical protein